MIVVLKAVGQEETAAALMATIAVLSITLRSLFDALQTASPPWS